MTKHADPRAQRVATSAAPGGCQPRGYRCRPIGARPARLGRSDPWRDWPRLSRRLWTRPLNGCSSQVQAVTLPAGRHRSRTRKHWTFWLALGAYCLDLRPWSKALSALASDARKPQPMPDLSRDLRRALASVIEAARGAAEASAADALRLRLGVFESRRPGYLDDARNATRKRLARLAPRRSATA